MPGRAYALKHPLRQRPKHQDAETRRLAAEGRQKSALEKIQKRTEAVKDYCICCAKDCNNSCSFFQYKDQGNASLNTIRQICWKCLSDRNYSTGDCQSWNCRLRPYFVRKPRSKLRKEMDDFLRKNL